MCPKITKGCLQVESYYCFIIVLSVQLLVDNKLHQTRKCTVT